MNKEATKYESIREYIIRVISWLFIALISISENHHVKQKRKCICSLCILKHSWKVMYDYSRRIVFELFIIFILFNVARCLRNNFEISRQSRLSNLKQDPPQVKPVDFDKQYNDTVNSSTEVIFEYTYREIENKVCKIGLHINH